MWIQNWAVFWSVTLRVACVPHALPNDEFNRLLLQAAEGNLTQDKSVKPVAPYHHEKTLLDRFMENPGKKLAYSACYTILHIFQIILFANKSFQN